jgi:hypothetical protein
VSKVKFARDIVPELLEKDDDVVYYDQGMTVYVSIGPKSLALIIAVAFPAVYTYSEIFASGSQYVWEFGNKIWPW